MTRNAHITGWGMSVPERIMTNDDIAERVQTNHEWIVERTGIHQRHVAGPGVAASDLSAPAAELALKRAGLDARDIDLVIVATITPDMPFPATAAVVADRIGAGKVAAYDLQAGCTGFVYALTQAYSTIVAGLAARVLVVGVDLLTNYVDWDDRGTCILFGDGAGAVVLTDLERAGGFEYISGYAGSSPDHDAIIHPAGGSKIPTTHESIDGRLHHLKMDGKRTFKFAVRTCATMVKQSVEDLGGFDELAVVVPHQMNQRIIEAAAERLDLSIDMFYSNIAKYGNTSAASVPIGRNTNFEAPAAL